MDRSLKKLTRVELLELMVNLSEDYERLSIENERLRKAAKSQRLPRSAKVGSLAEAALKANGYFDAAQRSADEYLREIKTMRDELVSRTNRVRSTEASQRAESQALIADAQVQAQQILSRAQAQAERILADARVRSEQALADASRQSRPLSPQAYQGVQGAQGVQGVQGAQVAQGVPTLTRSSVPIVENGLYGQAGNAAANGGAVSLQTGDIPRVNPSPAQSAAFQPPMSQPQGQAARQVAQPAAFQSQAPARQMQVPSVYEHASTSQTPASRQGFSIGSGYSRPYTGASSYSGSRSYLNTAPAYAGGTAVQADAPDTTSELPIRSEGMRYIPGRSF